MSGFSRGGSGNDPDAIHDNVAGEISAITSKPVPVNADILIIEDSAAGDAKKKVTIGSLPGGGTTGVVDFASLLTTNAVQTTVGTYTPGPDTTTQANWRVTAKRDNDDFASWQWLGQVLVIDSFSVFVNSANNTASAAPDFSGGTGSSLRIALDIVGGLRLRVTGNAGENWVWQAQINYIETTP